MTSDERQALGAFVGAVRVHYGKRLHDVILFGSRARGEAGADSDYDVAVVLADGNWLAWRERQVMSNLAYDILVDAGIDIQPWPIAKSDWEHPAKYSNPRFIANVRNDGRYLSEHFP